MNFAAENETQMRLSLKAKNKTMRKNNKQLSKPLWQLTTGEFLDLLKTNNVAEPETVEVVPQVDNKEKRYVHGIPGIAQLFNCSIATANRIKSSGKIDDAITQVGRKIVIDADLALELARESTWQNKRGRR